jgi:hypothetical protein
MLHRRAIPTPKHPNPKTFAATQSKLHAPQSIGIAQAATVCLSEGRGFLGAPYCDRL